MTPPRGSPRAEGPTRSIQQDGPSARTDVFLIEAPPSAVISFKTPENCNYYGYSIIEGRQQVSAQNVCDSAQAGPRGYSSGLRILGL